MTRTVSVIITTHRWGRYGDFRDAIRSVESQTYENIELVCPIDADPDMADATRAIADGGVTVAYDAESTGLAAARNHGAEKASGDIYAFLDDDCVADPEWISTLVRAYEGGALAAGGPAHPAWPDGKGRPPYLPKRWDWLVGGGPYHETEQDVRNTYGCNLSVRADVFDELGGFDRSLGKNDSLDQGEEAELCTRLYNTFGERVRYMPDASVTHRIFNDQLRAKHLLKRAHAQGRTKRKIGVGGAETSFLTETLRSLLTNRPTHSIATVGFLAAVGLGYSREDVKRRWSL